MRLSGKNSADAWVAAAVIFAVAAFLILCIPLLHMHPDEELSYRATNGSLLDTLRWQIDLEDNQAPLWFLGLNIWRRLVGDAEYTSRVLGVMFVLPALALVYRMARSSFGRQSAAFTPLVLIGNGLFFQYALDIRMYPLVMLVSAISTFLLWRWLQKPTLRAALLYGVSIALMLYTHYLLVFFLVGHGLYFLIAAPLTRRRIQNGVAALAISVVLFLPWIPIAISQINHLRQVEAASGTARGGVGIGVSTFETNAQTIQALANFATSYAPLLYALVLIMGVVVIARRQNNIDSKAQRRKEKLYSLAVIWAIVVPAVYLLVNTRAGVYAPRYISYLTLGLALGVGGTLGLLPTPRWLRWIPLIGLVVLNLNNFGSTLPVRIPFRGLLAEVSAASEPGDVVLLVRAGEDDGFVQWQLDHYLPPELSRTTDLSLATEARRVWMLTGDWFNGDVRAAFNTLEPSHPVQQVVGDCNNNWCYLAQLMEAPPLTEPIRFGDALDFRGAQVNRGSIGLRWGPDVDVRLWWTINAALPVNYSFSLRLVDPSGELIAQSDGAINHYGQEVVETSTMQPGRIFIDYRSVQFPLGAAEGMYALRLVVYDPATGEPLILPDGSDSLLLQMLGID